MLREGSYATFPTKLVAEKADEIVEKCMKRGIDGAVTIGAVVVGPERVTVVVLMRKRVDGGKCERGADRVECDKCDVVATGRLLGT